MRDNDLAAVGFTGPSYGGNTIGDVLPAVASALGVDVGFHETGLSLPPAPAYVVVLIDGLGHDLLQRHRREAPFLSSLSGAIGSAGVPSTTATSLSSLGTALTPGQHGLIGFTSRVPGTDRLLNHLFWDKAVDPLEWQPHPTAFARLAERGVATSVVSKSDFATSGLTRSIQRGASYVGANDADQRLAATVRAAGTQPSVTYVYDSDLDSTGHKHGVDSPQWRAQLSIIDDALEQMREELPGHARMVVIADHGMVDATDEADRLDIDDFPDLRRGVSLLGGEARFRQVYCHVGAEADVVAAWGETLGERAHVVRREDAVAAGWFGDVEERVTQRLGDVLVAARGTTALFSSADFGYEMSLIGLHGSMTPAEMNIPILLA